MRGRLASLSVVTFLVALSFAACTSSTPSNDTADASTGDSGGGFCRSCEFVIGSPMGFSDPAMCPKNTCPTPPNGNPKSCMLWCCVQSPSAAPFAYPCDLRDAAVDASGDAPVDASGDAPTADADATLD